MFETSRVFLRISSQKPIIGESCMHELKSSTKIMLSYFDESESILLERQFICDSMLFLFGL